MRTDYELYALAIICFIIAGLVSSGTVPQYLPELETFEGTFIIVIFTALGLIFAIVGYSLRPKPIIPIPEVTPPASPPPSPHSLAPPEEATNVPSPVSTSSTAPQKEITKPEREKPKTRPKRTTRRKKKA